MTDINADLASKTSKLEQQLEAANRHISSLTARNTELSEFEREVRANRTRIAELEAALNAKTAAHEAATREAADVSANAANVKAHAAGVAASHAELVKSLKKLVG